MEPTVGRIVHFYEFQDHEPHPAIVTAIRGRMVNLTVFHNEREQHRMAVPYAETPTPGHWTWPPKARHT